MTIIISILNRPGEYGFWLHWGSRSKTLRLGWLDICFMPVHHDVAIWAQYQALAQDDLCQPSEPRLN